MILSLYATWKEIRLVNPLELFLHAVLPDPTLSMCLDRTPSICRHVPLHSLNHGLHQHKSRWINETIVKKLVIKVCHSFMLFISHIVRYMQCNIQYMHVRKTPDVIVVWEPKNKIIQLIFFIPKTYEETCATIFEILELDKLRCSNKFIINYGNALAHVIK